MANGTMGLARKVAPSVFNTLKEFSAALDGGPVPFKSLLAHGLLRHTIDQVRKEANCKWPYTDHLLEKALQHLRKQGDVRSTPKGWVLTGAVVEPTETLSSVEYEILKVSLSVEGPLRQKILNALQYRKDE